MSGQDKVLVHHGAALRIVSAGDLLEFFVVAEIKGEIAQDDDHDTFSQLMLRCKGQHAFSNPEGRAVARELLDIWDEKPDDAAMIKLLDGWRRELYGARAPYTSASAVDGLVRRWNG